MGAAVASRAATPSLQPQSGTPHPPLLRGFVHRNMGYSGDSILHENLNLTSLNQIPLRLLH